MRTSALFAAKTGFFVIYGVSERTREREIEPVGQGGGGSIFRDFVQTSLWTAPYLTTFKKYII